MTEFTQDLASRWKRLGGTILDGLISSVIIFPIVMMSGIFQQIRQGQEMSTGQSISFALFGFVVFLLINGYLLAKQGQTVGKKIVGTRIVSADDGEILPVGKVIGLRYLPIFVIGQLPIIGSFFSLLDALFIFRGDKRCIHDLIAGSKVVDA